ncbi:HAD domain-containing protein [Streptomyces canus]|uniref:HAD domain-containing protein n=1 Tax=Streptomyces canus TaxID=58343 RepID=UPI0036E531B7
MNTGRPLLYLDVDGPLNPYAAKPERRPEGYTTHRMKPDGWLAQHPGLPPSRVKPLRVWLNPAHGQALLKLTDRYDLVWATTWRHEANTFIAPVLGLPPLPFVDWPTTLTPGPNGTFWKTHHLVTHAEGRPFVWLDDELDDKDREFVTAHHDGPALLRWVDPRVGLRETDFEVMADFARGV